MNTPAVTMVAAWMSAETGVGPSIASGNQVCSRNCADLPIAPMKRRNTRLVIDVDSRDRTTARSCRQGPGAAAKIVSNETDLVMNKSKDAE